MATNVNNETGLIGITPKYKFHDQVTIDTGDTIQDVTWLDCEYLAKFKKNSLGPMIVRPDYIYEDTSGSLARNGVTIVGVTTENTLARVTDPEVLRILLANISHTLDSQIRLSEVASGSIGAAWFAGNTKIEVFDCPRGYSVAASAFNGCTGLREVFIQRNVSLGNSAFNGCNRVDCYHFLDTNVGTFGTTVFAGLSGSCYLYVPNEAVVNYCKVANLGSYITRIRGHIKGWHLICADGSYKYNLRDCYDTATNISFRLEGTYITNLALSVDPDTNEATVTVTGMLPDTDENAQLYYEFDYRNHHFSGYVPLHLKTDAAEIIEFEDPEVKRICVANWGGIYRMTLDGYEGELTKEQAAKVSSIGTAFQNRTYTHLDLSMFTSVTAFNTGHLSYINAPYIILPPNARSIENYGIAHSRVTYLIITYTAGTFAFNGSWNNSSTISYIYVPDTKVSAYSGRTVYPIIGQEGIIERDREFTLTIPVARYGWNSDLHWSVEENDYISIVSQGDGVATFRATGISPETDTTVTLSYQSNHGNGFFKGTKVLTVKPTPVIEFEDAEAKRICVANWGGGLSVITKVQGVPGELTYAQAAAVKSIDYKFLGNKVMTSFEEFQYFTGGVTSSTINNVRFANCTNLTKIIIPNMGDHILARWFFSNCSKLELVKVMEGNVRVNGWFVNECVKLKFLLMPSTLNQLAVASSGRYEHFYNTPATCAYIYKGTSPASVVSGSNTFSNAKGRFYVPDESVELYKVSVGWSGVAARIFPMSQLPKDKPDCPWLEELSEEGILRDYIDFEDAEVKRICCTNWGDYTEVVETETVTEEEETVSISTVYTYVHKVNTAATRTDIKTITSSRAKTEEDEVGETSTTTIYPLGMTKAQCAAVSSLGTVFNSNSVITKFNELKYFTNVHSINNGFVACTSLTEIDLSNITSLGTGALQSSGIVYVYAPLARSASQGSGSTGWAASTYSLIGCLWKSLTSISVGGMYNSTNKYHIFLMETPPTTNNGLNRWTGRTYVPDIYMSNYQEDSIWSSLVRSLSLLETDYPDCPWLDELREGGYIE